MPERSPAPLARGCARTSSVHSLVVDDHRPDVQKTAQMPATTEAPASTDAPEFLGVFSPRRAGALAGVSGDQVGRWARYGWIRPTVYEGRPANRYAFFDVAEAIVVHWLRDDGFRYPEIHEAIAAARAQHPLWPLVHGELGVARHTVEATAIAASSCSVRPRASTSRSGARPGKSC
jgi:hypothetical protein